MSAHLSANFKNDKYDISIGLSLFIWEEEAMTYIYSPALDLTGYGSTEVEARASFEATLEEFVKYTHNKGTIYDELEHLGWLVNRKKKRVSAPSPDQLAQENDTLKDILSNQNLRQENRDLQLAMP